MFSSSTDQANGAQKASEEQTAATQAGGEGTVVSPVNGSASHAAADGAASTEQHQGGLSVPSPSQDDSAAPAAATSAPVAEEEKPAEPAGVPAPTASPDELLSLKQDALAHLSPLVTHLEQSPEERFRTLMMMIQAADDHTKIKEAYEAAQKIEDDKVRAQALLDVVNEINYFTQHSHKTEK